MTEQQVRGLWLHWHPQCYVATVFSYAILNNKPAIISVGTKKEV